MTTKEFDTIFDVIHTWNNPVTRVVYLEDLGASVLVILLRGRRAVTVEFLEPLGAADVGALLGFAAGRIGEVH